MAVRDDFTAGEVLAAADLNDTFASKLPYSYGTATPSTTDSGFLWYDSNSTPAATKFWDGSAFVPFGGKILQIVRATDSTQRSTNSGSYVDVTGMAVTITPSATTSAILIIAVFNAYADDDGNVGFSITDSSNNPISGAEGAATYFGATWGSAKDIFAAQTLFAYATPATTSATTYKLRFRTNGTGSALVNNAQNTGQMYALEISA